MPEVRLPPHGPEDVHWMLVDMNSYFASCEQQFNPDLRGKSIAVVPMLNVPTATILAASVEAKKFGIKTGTLVAEAKRRCKTIQFVPMRHELYVKIHEQIIEAIETVLPIEQVLSIDEFGCRLTGTQKNPEYAKELALKIKNKIESTVGECLTTSIGIAENLILSKIASDLIKPNGLVMINAKNREEILNPLPVQVIPGVGIKTQQKLNRFGIYTLKDLYEVSQERLSQIWGETLAKRYYGWIRGAGEHRTFEHGKSLGHQHVLEPHLRNIQDAILVLKQLLIRATARLRRNELYAKSMSLLISFTEGDPWKGSVRFDETHDPILLLKIMNQMLGFFLKSVQNLPSQSVPIKVGVTFSNLVANDRHQFSLFEDPKREQLLQKIDELNAKFGRTEKGNLAVSFASVSDLEVAKTSAIAFSHIPDSEDLV